MKIIDTESGPFYKGLGDVVTLAWLSKNVPGIGIVAHNEKAELALKLECSVFTNHDEKINPSPAYEEEYKDFGIKKRLEYLCDFLKITPPPHWNAPKYDAEFSFPVKASLIDKAQGKKIILLCPQSHHKIRMWHAPGWLMLWSLLKKFGHFPVFIFDKFQKDFQQSEYRVGYSIDQLAYAMEVADCFVGIDSFAAHLWTTCGRSPGVVLMGPTRHHTIFSHSNKLEPISFNNMSCTGCHYRHEIGYVWSICEIGCRSLYSIRPEDVFTKVCELLNRKQ